MVGGRTDVAIIGMACVFPKAPDLRSFWENILAGVDAIGDPPAGSGTAQTKAITLKPNGDVEVDFTAP